LPAAALAPQLQEALAALVGRQLFQFVAELARVDWAG